MRYRSFLGLLAVLTPVYLVLAAVLPPADDELYYWCWSEQLQLSYYDHPPMTAYMIRAATSVLGDNLVAIRLPAIVSTLTVLAVIGFLTRPRSLLPLVIFTPLFTLGAVLVTPDTPLIMFWALYLLWLVKVHERLQEPNPPAPFPGREGGEREQSASSSPPLLGEGLSRPGVGLIGLWLIGGVILGCGILGKYTMGLAMIAGFLSFAVAGNWRRWLPGYALHIAVAVVVTLPILVHNIRHDFIPLQYQWKHSMSSPQPGLIPFLSFVGIQLLLFGAVPFAVFMWTLVNRRDVLADPRLRVCAGLFAFPFAFFLYKATRGPLEGNWALGCYIAVWPLAAAWYDQVKGSRFWRLAARGSFAVPASCVVILAVHLAWPISLIEPHQDRITRQKSRMEVARQVAAALREQGATEPVYVPTYQWAALLRFQGIDARQIDGITRPSHFTQTPEQPSDRGHALVFTDQFIPESHVQGFAPPRYVAIYPLMVRGKLVGGYWLLEYTRPPANDSHLGALATAARFDPPQTPRQP